MTATTKRGVKCGNCKSYHADHAAVRACYFGPNIVTNGPPITDLEADAKARTGRDPRNPGAILSQEMRDRWSGRNTTSSQLQHGRKAGRPVSPEQEKFITDLISERETAEPMDADAVIAALNTLPNPRQGASVLIEGLVKLPVRPVDVRNPTQVNTGSEMPNVSAGYYAVPSASSTNDLDFYRVSLGKGRWNGRIFVQRVVGGKPDINVRRNQQASALTRIQEFGVEAAARLYAAEIGNCYRCNRHLTDETSRRLGIGPDCRKR